MTAVETPQAGLKWIGKDIKRREDPALLTGSAVYTDRKSVV